MPIVFGALDQIRTTGTPTTTDGAVVFAEPSRKYTASLYPRRVFGKQVLKDLDLFRKVADELLVAFPDYDIGPDSAVRHQIILKPKGVLKSTLIPRLSASGHVASFGDSRDDVCMFKCSAFCGAPANASAETKEAVLMLV
jgi:hydroxymethylpyrimidine pyrophosphatase-like HAD family hydrolase